MAKNERGAGRKAAIFGRDIDEIRRRHESGETITALAFGISRQKLQYPHLFEG